MYKYTFSAMYGKKSFKIVVNVPCEISAPNDGRDLIVESLKCSFFIAELLYPPS